MFNKQAYDNMSAIQKDDYLNLMVIGPARMEAKRRISQMSSTELIDRCAGLAAGFRVPAMLEYCLMNEIVLEEFKELGI
jgi:hypothetical protein